MTTTGPGTATGASGKAEAAKGAASDVAHEATQAAAGVKDTAKDEVRSVVSDATQRAGDVMRTTQGELRTQATEKTKQLSTTLDDIGRQLASMADSADDPDSQVAQLSRTAGEQIRRQSRRLEDGGLDGLVDDVKRFARNRPGAFLLGTVAAGFVAGRIGKHADLKQTVEAAKSEVSGGDSQSSNGSAPADAAGNPPAHLASAPPAPAAVPPAGGTPTTAPTTGATPTGGTSVFEPPAPGQGGDRL